jgi:hypothetical protein
VWVARMMISVRAWVTRTSHPEYPSSASSRVLVVSLVPVLPVFDLQELSKLGLEDTVGDELSLLRDLSRGRHYVDG